MENIFLKYMTSRTEEEETPKELGPVITLSREYGCYASKIAEMLIQKLNSEKQAKDDAWQCLSKEILDVAAKALETDPVKIAHVFGADKNTFLGDLAISFSSKKYASDDSIKKVVKTVVKSYAEHGNIVIVGRAGCVIAAHIPKALHIKLIAPLDWRINRIQERFNITKLQARKQVLEIDEKRDTFMKFYRGNKPEGDLFDAVINRAVFTDEQIVEMIHLLSKMKNVIR